MIQITSLRLSQLESCPYIITRSWFQHVKVFTYLSPLYFLTIPSKTRFGKNSTSWLKRYFPLFMPACVVFRKRIYGINSNRHAPFLLIINSFTIYYKELNNFSLDTSDLEYCSLWNLSHFERWIRYKEGDSMAIDSSSRDKPYIYLAIRRLNRLNFLILLTNLHIYI